MTQIPIMGDGLPQPLLEMLGAEFEVLPWDDAPDSPALARAEAVIAYGHPPVDGSLMDRAPQLKVISNHGVGVDHIDVAAALQRGIPVGNTPGCLDAATADMTMALMLATARNVVVGDKYARSPEFLHYDPAILIGQEVTGSKLGIIGMGRIGKQVAKRATGFDMQITYHNRHRDSEAESEYKAEYRSLDDLLAESDFVVLNCPLTPETTGLISGPQFEIMKSSAILINMARGPVVDPAALFTALSTGQIAAAGIDVTDPEPLPRGHELLTLENLIITPHLGSASNRTRERMMRMTVENLHAGLQGKPLPYSVDK
ncbi:Glyoxylate/hydroxypyruvate reductase B [Symmachiella dynata]|uniref:Glyoxylate/hydroxypyruvate reductase B n=1 Tax=Symmachiella dynata TaxID=2527995 RepID=A0A517ZNE9_9PLAN|nr:D-glycerate dehydrogenase [Symmachiella dynata]QDU43980.1 Glyoxylate/hydroxypyruvate reductase B [Symmachiella dynata]